MTKIKSERLLLLAITFFVFTGKVVAQCNQSDISPIAFQKIVASEVTCPQNGSITLSGVSGGGGQFVYEIFAGPLKRGVQTQPVFSALVAGIYSVRLTGCNGKFIETNVVIANKYIEPPLPSLRFVKEQSLKCNTANTGKAVVSLNLDLPGSSFADSAFYSLPFTYQITAVKKQLTETGKEKTYTLHNSRLQAYEGNSKVLIKFDTITGLEAGKTYYIKVTDQCGVFKTASIDIPAIENLPLSYSFDLKEPFVLANSENNFRLKGNCIQWGELNLISNGSIISAIAGNNTYTPLSVKIIRLDNNQTVAERKITWGSLYKSENRPLKNDNNLLFDSLPRVALKVEITNQCGVVSTIKAKVANQANTFHMQAKPACFNDKHFVEIFTASGIPSLPVKFSLYGKQNKLLSSKILLSNAKQSIYLEGEAPQPSEAITEVAAYGVYMAVMEDACGRKESIEFESKPGSKLATKPEVSFNSYQSSCGAEAGNELFTVFINQQNETPISSIELLTGPNGIAYPLVAKTKLTASDKVIEQRKIFFFDSLIPGVYDVNITYGCGETLQSSFTTEDETTASIKGSLNFSVLSNRCTNKGNTVTGSAHVLSEDEQLLAVQKPQIRIMQAPAGFVEEIAVLNNGKDFYLPIELGNYNATTAAENELENGIETIAPKYSFQQLINGIFRFPSGNYTFQLYSKCSGKLLDSKSFTIDDAGYTTPSIGASAGLICDNGQARIVVNPSGGDGLFQYQIKEINSLAQSSYGPLQANNIFLLPSKTAEGSIYQVRAQDACGNSTVASVVVSAVTSKIYLANDVNNLDMPAKIVTGFVPGASYTWLQPGGTDITGNSNEVYFDKFKSSDIGNYSVAVNALEGCIKRTASGYVGNAQLSNKTAEIFGFDAIAKNNALVQLQWQTPPNATITEFEIQKSVNGSDWNGIGKVNGSEFSLQPNNKKFEYPDKIEATQKEPVLYYRIKYSINSTIFFTEVKRAYLRNDFKIEKVYPTNFSNTIYIDFVTASADKAVLLLKDLSGKEVQQATLPVSVGINHVQLNAKADLSAGSYLLVLTQGKNKFVTMLIKTE